MGHEVHSWIEEQARGLTGLADEDSLDQPSRHMSPSKVQGLRRSFRAMGYADRKLAYLEGGEPMAELPFVLKLGRRLIRGRIDAVYAGEEGEPGLEIVDFKTGAEVIPPEIDQLVIYAGALAKLGMDLDRPLKLTFCYLASGQTRSRTIEGRAAVEALEKLDNNLTALGV